MSYTEHNDVSAIRVQKGYFPGQLSVPAHMTRAIGLVGARFRAEWHADGILYRFIGHGDVSEIAELPDWAKKQ